MEVDEATLFNRFINETQNHRRAFIKSLEEKYVKNQKESDVFELHSLKIQQNKGQTKKIKRCLKFGYMKSYSCEKGQRILQILRRKIKSKRKIRLTIYGNGNKSRAEKSSKGAVKIQKSSKGAVKIQKSSIQLLRLDAKNIKSSKWTDIHVVNFLNNERITINKKNEIINETPKFTKTSVHSLAFERKKNPLSHLQLNVKKKPLISSQIVCDEIKSSNLRSSQYDYGKSKFKFINPNSFMTEKVSNVDNRKENHCSSLTVTSEKFKNSEIKDKSKFVSFYNSFDNLNLSDFNLQNCPELSSKTGGKLPSYEINALYRKQLQPYKRSSHSSSKL